MRTNYKLSSTRWNLFTVGTGVLLAGYIAFLIVANYLAHAAQKKASFHQMRIDAARRAAVVSYFLSEREHDLEDLAASRVVTGFFENRDLGMSIEYGLRASLEVIRKRFEELLGVRVIGKTPIYVRMALVDKSGGVLVDSQPEIAGSKHLGRRPILVPQSSKAAVGSSPGDMTSPVIVSAPCRFKGKYAGEIIAWVDLRAVYDHLLGATNGVSDRFVCLAAEDGHILLPAGIEFPLGDSDLPNNGKPDPWKMYNYNRSTGKNGEHRSMLLFSSPVEGSPFYLLNVSSASYVFGASTTLHFLLAMGALSLLVLSGIIALRKVHTDRLILQVRFEEASKGQRELAGKNEQLAREIIDREGAECALRESEEQLRLLSSRLLDAQEEERKRISRELHDSIGASLSVIKFGLEKVLGRVQQDSESVQSIESLVVMTQRTIDEARKLMTDLRPSLLDDLGLLATVGWLCRQFQTVYSNIHVERIIEVEEEEIPEPLKIVIFRVMQEAFHNIAKHSQAEFVDLTLSNKNGGIQLIVEDNGKGFDPQAVLSKECLQKGLGLTSMRERVELSSGVFSIESTLGKGTVITASWPGESLSSFGDRTPVRSVFDECRDFEKYRKVEPSSGERDLHQPSICPCLWALEHEKSAGGLKQGCALYQTLFEDNHAIMLFIDPETHQIIDANPTACRFYGYDKEELTGKKITEINTLPEEEVVKEIERAKTGVKQQFSFSHQLANGNRRNVEVYSGPVRIKGRNLLYSIVHDITDRKRAEEALKEAHRELDLRVQERTTDLQKAVDALKMEVDQRRQAEKKLRRSKERYRAVVESQTELVSRFLPDGTLTFVNSAYCRYFGESPEELIGKKFWHHIPAQEAEKFREHLTAMGKDLSVEVIEHQVIDASGKIRWQRWTDRAILNGNGEIVEFQAVGSDVTERKHMEEALRLSEERLRELMARSPIAIGVTNLKGEIEYLNGKFTDIFGYVREEIPHMRDWAARVYPDEGYRRWVGEYWKREVKRAIAEEREVEPVVYRIVCKDGLIREVEIRASIINGKLFTTFLDITEQKRMVDALRVSEKELRSLSSRLLTAQEAERALIAIELHDHISQTLAAIKFGLGNALGAKEENRLDEAFQSIEGVIPLLQTAIHEVRRIYMGLRPSVLDDFGIIPALDWLRKEFQEIYPEIEIERNIEIHEWELPEQLKLVLYRVVQQALQNVAEHSQANYVTLSLMKEHDRIELTIEDEGVGFDIDEAITSRSTHQGVGLASMRQRVELSGGTFSIESALEEGTIIRASWPVRDKAVALHDSNQWPRTSHTTSDTL